MPRHHHSIPRTAALPEEGAAGSRALGTPFDRGLADEVLVLRGREGDRWAEEALFRRYVVPLTAMITHVVGNTADADDVVQDAFGEALRDLPKLREPAAFRAWLYRIAINRAKKAIRKRRLLRMLGLDRSLDDATLAIDAEDGTSPEARMELALLDEALAHLPADERIAWMLRYVHGHSLEEIAEWLGCSLATVKRRIAATQLGIDAHVAGRKA